MVFIAGEFLFKLQVNGMEPDNLYGEMIHPAQNGR